MSRINHYYFNKCNNIYQIPHTCIKRKINFSETKCIKFQEATPHKSCKNQRGADILLPKNHNFFFVKRF